MYIDLHTTHEPLEPRQGISQQYIDLERAQKIDMITRGIGLNIKK